MTVEITAHFGRNGETGRNRQAQTRHLGEIGALAAEQIAHLSSALRLAAAEGIDPLGGRRFGGNGFGSGEFGSGGFGDGGLGGDAFYDGAWRCYRRRTGGYRALA